ncbi:ABC transporter substrate-binding protein [Desulfosarcina sp. OttesenSCG-928-A07]|nr:ABC transporter substrate-binding protein [Desulfosarcina sp. OttesenSCG-928-G17]MDL2328381.1 ABC transporter substrate-binding protein [Desulfosarcina sp. OttesenSCG-928-A07]
MHCFKIAVRMSLALILLTAGPLFAGQQPSPASPKTRTLIDMRGKTVTFPADLKKVATIDDGFVEGVMTHLGVIHKVAAIGSWSLKREYRYEFQTASGETYVHQGLNTMKYLHPWLNDLPCFNSPQGNVLNFETLALAEPDLVIIREGDCTIREDGGEKNAQAIATIEGMGIPVVVIYTPGYFRKAELSSLKDEMAVIGDVFGQKEKAAALADYLSATEKMIRDRTAGILDADKTSVLYLGLNPDIRKKGAVGSVFGVNTPESFIIEHVVNAKNAFRGNGYGLPLSTEQIYALDPDVIVLPTSSGYHPPRELYEAPYFENLGELRAVKNRRVYAMPWSPMNCARRVEYPLDMLIIAKAAYPDRFSDIKVHAAALKFYQDVYGVDANAAAGLRTTQMLDWMTDHDF